MAATLRHGHLYLHAGMPTGRGSTSSRATSTTLKRCSMPPLSMRPPWHRWATFSLARLPRSTSSPRASRATRLPSAPRRTTAPPSPLDCLHAHNDLNHAYLHAAVPTSTRLRSTWWGQRATSSWAPASRTTSTRASSRCVFVSLHLYDVGMHIARRPAHSTQLGGVAKIGTPDLFVKVVLCPRTASLTRCSCR